MSKNKPATWQLIFLTKCCFSFAISFSFSMQLASSMAANMSFDFQIDIVFLNYYYYQINLAYYLLHQMKASSEDLILQTHNIRVKDGEVYSQIIFTESSKNRVPMVFLHGGPGGQHNKMKWGMKALAKQFPLIFYDQLGSGKSKKIDAGIEATKLWTIQNFVQQLQRVVEFYKLSNFILFGTSWGGTLALQYYFSESTTVRPMGMILNSPLVSTSIWLVDSNILKADMPKQIYDEIVRCENQGDYGCLEYMKAISKFNEKHVIRTDMLTPDHYAVLDEIRGRFNVQAYELMWGPCEFNATGTLKTYQRFEDLSKLDLPVLFTSGQFDEVRAQTIEKLKQKTPKSRSYLFKKCSHCSFFEDPRSYKPVILKFYKEVAGTQNSEY